MKNFYEFINILQKKSRLNLFQVWAALDTMKLKKTFI